MRTRSGWVLGLLTLAVLGATSCQEQLTAPAQCPQACPGGRPVIRDTVLTALLNGDSAYSGYIISGSSLGGLLVSDSLGGLDDRAFMRMLPRPDTIYVDSALGYRTFAVDSVALSVTVMAHDTAVHGLFLYLYRLPAATDSGQTFGAVDSLLAPGALFDSVAVSDTLVSQTLRLVYFDSTLAKMDIPPADSGKLAFGFRVRASAPTGARLGGIGSGSSIPILTTYVTVAGDTDTTTMHQTIIRAPEYTKFVERSTFAPDPNLLVVGGQNGSRVLVRFPFPAYLTDSVVLVRATLQLTPNDTIGGLRGDSTAVVASGILADFGAKSPRFSLTSTTTLAPGSIDTIGIEVVSQVKVWQTANPAVPYAFMVNLNPEGASFSEPRFRSTRSASGAPTLRITYQVPFNFERP
ncbi:MAG: hypothetical protein WBC97_02845 [Gemmatimonadales bacterium]